MTYEQNVRAILESNFAESKDEIVDIAVHNIMALSENKGDLISRIEAESVLHNNLHALIDTDQLYQLYKDINRLPIYSAENKREWTPTIERLPEIGDTVLCSVKTPECTDHHIIICKYCAEEFWKDGTIRAWQPLPEPYKSESEGK